MVSYRIEIVDTWGRRIASYDETPLLEATRRRPDESDEVRGLLPGHVADLSPGYVVRVFVGDTLFCEARVTRVKPQWSDTRKLILDRYVSFHEAIEFEAERLPDEGNAQVSRGYTNWSVGAIVKSAINEAVGRIHYGVAHGAYPDGAQREYAKFLARKTVENELEIGGIAEGQWVGSDRMDLSGAYAKDGDTVAGIVVDGAAWPDVRMMLIDAEETGRNWHAIKRHPEVADWTDEEYAASGYKFQADAATSALQDLIDSKGIDYIELNPHRDASGEFDDRVDAYGRYLGLVFGGGECFNAALVEQGLAEVYLYKDGLYLAPEMALKDFFSYVGPNEDSIEETEQVLVNLEVGSGVLEVLTALAYAAGGYVWSMGPELCVGFRKAEKVDRLAFFDPVVLGVGLGSDSGSLVNALYFEGNPLAGALSKTYTRGASLDEYGFSAARLRCFSLSKEADADKLAEGLLDDVAYPEPCGLLEFHHGDAAIGVGDIVEVRDGPLRRLEREVNGEWGDRFAGELVGRVRRVTHRFTGKRVTTRAWLTSPLRSVSNPLTYIARGQDSATVLFEFRLDDAAVGLDMGYHLD